MTAGGFLEDKRDRELRGVQEVEDKVIQYHERRLEYLLEKIQKTYNDCEKYVSLYQNCPSDLLNKYHESIDKIQYFESKEKRQKERISSLEGRLLKLSSEFDLKNDECKDLEKKLRKEEKNNSILLTRNKKLEQKQKIQKENSKDRQAWQNKFNPKRKQQKKNHKKKSKNPKIKKRTDYQPNNAMKDAFKSQKG